MSVHEFALPDVGEGLTEAAIVQWHVAVGDTVEHNQTLVEIETAKSLVELPSPVAGTVRELRVSEGETVDVGTVILVMSVNADAQAGEGAPVPVACAAACDDSAYATETSGATDSEPVTSEAAMSAAAPAPAPEPASDEGSGSVLVGYGTQAAPRSRRRARSSGRSPGGLGGNAQGLGSQAAKRNALNAPADQLSASRQRRNLAPGNLGRLTPAAKAFPIIAKPPIRKLARDLGVDLSDVEATGLAGETTRDDVLRHAKQASVFKNLETPAPEPEAAREEVIPVRGVRKAIANAMVSSMFTAPHVTLFVDVDATRTMEFVKRLKESPDFAGVKVSPLLIVAKAVMWALRRNPTVNASWSDEAYTLKRYVNLGIAAATPRGLLVPNIKDAHEMGLKELAEAIAELTLRARDGKTQPAEQQGGTFTITNIGVFGMDSGTPILNPGEVGILALGTIKDKPWVVDGELRVRKVTTLTASFDHRLVDGDVASRFLADVAQIVEEPAMLLD